MLLRLGSLLLPGWYTKSQTGTLVGVTRLALQGPLCWVWCPCGAPWPSAGACQPVSTCGHWGVWRTVCVMAPKKYGAITQPNMRQYSLVYHLIQPCGSWLCGQALVGSPWRIVVWARLGRDSVIPLETQIPWSWVPGDHREKWLAMIYQCAHQSGHTERYRSAGRMPGGVLQPGRKQRPRSQINLQSISRQTQWKVTQAGSGAVLCAGGTKSASSQSAHPVFMCAHICTW